MDELRTTIERSLSGEDRAFGALVARYQNMAVGYGMSLLGDFHLAQDAAQEAFLAAHRELPTLAEPAAFPGWLRKIVFKYCDRIRRTRPVVAFDPDIALDRVDSDSDPAMIYAAAEAKAERDAKVAAALQSLAETDRNVIILFYMGDCSINEISVFLQISQPAVKKRLQRARERLKERMLIMVGETLTENAPSRNIRFTEAASLLRRATQLLEDDDRVVAAWLADSFGASGDTGWSSAWLQVIVKGETIDDFIMNATGYASQLAEPILCGIGPQNAPPGGMYCHALYDGEAGPYEFNWYWQPQRGATIPTGTLIPSEEARPVTHVLLNRASVPFSGEVLRCEYNRNPPEVYRKWLDALSEEDKWCFELSGTVLQYWAMLLISARQVGAAPNDDEPRHIGHIMGLLAEVQDALGRPQKRPCDRVYSDTASKLAILREAVLMMEALMPDINLFGTIISPNIGNIARRFMDMIERTKI